VAVLQFVVNLHRSSAKKSACVRLAENAKTPYAYLIIAPTLSTKWVIAIAFVAISRVFKDYWIALVL